MYTELFCRNKLLPFLAARTTLKIYFLLWYTHEQKTLLLGNQSIYVGLPAFGSRIIHNIVLIID